MSNWTPEEDSQLKQWRSERITYYEIGRRLNRSEKAVGSRLRYIGFNRAISIRDLFTQRKTKALAVLTEAAEHGWACPSNMSVGRVLGMDRGNTSKFLNRLHRLGVIRIEIGDSGRRIVIVKTGLATGWAPYHGDSENRNASDYQDTQPAILNESRMKGVVFRDDPRAMRPERPWRGRQVTHVHYASSAAWAA